MMTERYLLPVVPGVLLGLAVFVRPVAWLPVALAMWFFHPPVERLKQSLNDRAWYGLEIPARHVASSARAVSWVMTYKGAEVLDRGQMERLLVDAFARNGRNIRAHWGLSKSGPQIILAYPSIRKAQCLTFRHSSATTFVCQPK